MNYLSVEGLTKSYGVKTLFENVGFGIDQGQKVAFVAKNGTGKSTLLRLLNQIIKPSSGFFESNLPKPVPMLFQKPLILQNSVIYNYQILKQIKKHQINNTWFEKFDLLNLIFLKD